MITNFTDVEFLTAKEKKMILSNWINFLKFLASPKWTEFNASNTGSDYGMVAPKEFTKRLYSHLSLHCGYIAHYNIHGFYSTYFSGDLLKAKNFFERFIGNSCISDYDDLNNAMKKIYADYQDKIFSQAQAKNDDKFELLKECVKRAESDIEFRDKFLSKVYN
jgi:hypothetical protein